MGSDRKWKCVTGLGRSSESPGEHFLQRAGCGEIIVWKMPRPTQHNPHATALG